MHHDDHVAHHAMHDHAQQAQAAATLNKVALWATVHCLSGCAVGEVLGMVIGTAISLSNLAVIVLSTVLAFVFGYAFTVVPLLRTGMAPRAAAAIALASDTASIAVMEVVDNLVMLVVPGAMDAALDTVLFWGALAMSLALAGVAAYPVNRFLIARGKGHALVHSSH
jgi:hypothetical protein